MARLDLIVCDNCQSEVVATPETRAAMTQLVVTQGGSRSHVYELCPNCSSGYTTTLPENPADWPRFVSREAVRHWLRAQQARALPEPEPIPAGGNPWDNPAQRAAEKARREAIFDHVQRPTLPEAQRCWRVKVTLGTGATFTEDPVWAPTAAAAKEQVRMTHPFATISEPEPVSGA